MDWKKNILFLEKALQSLLESLTCPPYTPTQHLEREQALAKEFAEILHFTLRFDELKVKIFYCMLFFFSIYFESKLIITCFLSLRWETQQFRMTSVIIGGR